MKKILFLFLGLFLLTTNSFAVTESGSNDAQSVVLYGKTDAGALVPVKVASDGSVGGGVPTGVEISVVSQNGYKYNDILTSEGTSIVTYNGNQYVAFYDGTNHLALAKRSSTSKGDWSIYSYDGTGGRPNISVAANLDLHDSPALGIDSDGYLHVTYGMHTSALLYRKSTNPEDISNLGSVISMLGTNESQVTYPIFFTDRSTPHNLYFIFRDGASGDGSQYIYKYNVGTATWAAGTGTGTAGMVWDGKGKSYNAYVSYPFVDSNNNAHFGFTWRAACSGAGDDCNVSYVKYNLSTGAFTKSTGASQTIPMTTANTETVDSADGINNGLQPFQGRRNLAVDSSGTVYMTYAKWGSSLNFGQIWFTKNTGSGWSTPSQLTSTADVYTDSTDPTQNTPILLRDTSSNLYIVFKTLSLNHGITVLKSTDSGSNWTMFSIFNGNVGYWKTNNQDYYQWDANNKLSFLMQFSSERNIAQTRSPVYLLEWQPSYGGYNLPGPNFGIWNYDDISLYSHAGKIRLQGADVSFTDQNIIFLKYGDDISTAISSATAGDVIVLPAATITITSAITLDKAVHLVGQGMGRTIISTSTGSITGMITATVSGASVANLSLNSTGSGTQRCFYANGAATTVISNVNVYSVDCTMSGTGTQSAFQWEDASGSIFNPVYTITSSNGATEGIRARGSSTNESALTLNVYNPTCIMSTGGGTNSYCLQAQDNTSPTGVTMNVYGRGYYRVTETAAATSHAAFASGGTDAVMNLYGGTFSATDYDFDIQNSATMNLYSATSVNNTANGTPTYLGYRTGGAVIGKTSTSTNTVKTGANTACNTTCAGSQCEFGVDDTNKLPLACTDATADTCVCLGP